MEPQPRVSLLKARAVSDGGRIMQTIVRQTYKQAASLLVLIALAQALPPRCPVRRLGMANLLRPASPN